MKVKMILPPLTEARGPFWWPLLPAALVLMALPGLMATWWGAAFGCRSFTSEIQ